MILKGSFTFDPSRVRDYNISFCQLRSRMIKKTLKRILGDYWIFRIKNLKNKLFVKDHSKVQADTTLYQTFVKPGDLCFDVGANIGNKVDIFLKLKARVVAVEPQESCYKILKYKYGNNITLVKKGLGENE